MEVSSQSLVHMGARPLLCFYCSMAVPGKTFMVTLKEHVPLNRPQLQGWEGARRGLEAAAVPSLTSRLSRTKIPA